MTKGRNWVILNDLGSPMKIEKWNPCFSEAKSCFLVLTFLPLLHCTLWNAFLEFRGMIYSYCSSKLSCRGRFFPYFWDHISCVGCYIGDQDFCLLKTVVDCQVRAGSAAVCLSRKPSFLGEQSFGPIFLVVLVENSNRRDHLVHLSSSRRVQQYLNHSWQNQFSVSLKPFSNGRSTASVYNPFHCLSFHAIRKVFLPTLG